MTTAIRARRNFSWRSTSAMLALLAVGLPLSARMAVGPPGAIVHLRWQESLGPAAREALETAFHLVDGERLDDRTWRYELIDPSSENVRDIVQHAAVEDTQGIDRVGFFVSALASRTDRRQQLIADGGTIVSVTDRLAQLLAAGAALLVWLGASGRAPTLHAAWSLVTKRAQAVWSACRTTTAARWLSRGIPEIDAGTAGAFRILFGVLVVLFFASHPEDADSLNQAFNPIVEGDLHASVLAWLRARPFLAEGLAPWLVTMGVAFTVGLFTRVTYALFVAGVAVWAFLATVHDSTHPNSTLVLTLVALLPSRWGEGLSVDAWRRSLDGTQATNRVSGKHYGYSVWVPGLVFGVAFAAAAWAKAVGTGPSWVLNGSVKYHFITDSLNAPVDWGLQLAGHPQLAVLASLGTVVAEALVITAAFSRNEWYRLGLGAVALGMLAGFGLFMGVFWYGWWILLLGFLPWARLRSVVRRYVPEMRAQTGGIHPARRIATLPSAAQLTAIAFVLGQQLVVSCVRIERAPMFTYYPMYSSTYPGPAQFDAAVRPYYRIVVRTAVGPVELTCNAPDDLVLALRAALDGSSEAASQVWREVRGCGSGLEDAASVTFEGDRRTFDWERLTFRIERAAIVLGPLAAP